MKRKIITIDEEKCTGCEECIPNCPEGAIQIIDGKARLISDLFCDGLGACIGSCPEEAITIEERDAEPYDEQKVMENIARAGANTIKAHLDHLKDHGQIELYAQAVEYLREHDIPVPSPEGAPAAPAGGSGCPGSRAISFRHDGADHAPLEGTRPSQLRNWPIQMHLISPQAPFFKNADLLLAADCVPFAMGDFHKDHLRGKMLAVACPKLDSNQEIYREKLKLLIDDARVNTITVMIMQVPCCGGLLRLAERAVAGASRTVPIKVLVVSLQGEVLREEWVQARAKPLSA